MNGRAIPGAYLFRLYVCDYWEDFQSLASQQTWNEETLCLGWRQVSESL